MRSFGVSLIVLISIVSLAVAHICLIYPEQRGGANITGPGSHACYQPQAPCGTIAPGSPKVVLLGGSTFNVLFQQNLNHYNPGFPGFLDVAWSTGSNQTSDSDFTVIGEVADYWPHLQASQTNFSVPVLVPNINCDHCTLRVRYHPNKPSEPIFHNCADVQIVQTASVDSSKWGNVYAIANPGAPFAGLTGYGEVMQVTRSGQLNPVSHRIGVRSTSQSSPNMFASQGLIAGDKLSGQFCFIGSSKSAFRGNGAPSTLYSYNSTSFSQTDITIPSSLQQWSGIVATGNPSTPFIVVGQMPSANQYSYAVYSLQSNGALSQNPLFTTPGDTTFVNTFWVEYDATYNRVFLLTGDEDSLYAMRVRLFTFNITTSSFSWTLVDNRQYTISSIHWDPTTNQLLALSPGLYSESTTRYSVSWTLIRIDPATGAVTPGPVVAPFGQYTANYAGGVYGPVTVDGEILHVFERAIDGARVLTGVDTSTGKFTFQTSFNNGVNNAFSLSSYAYVPPNRS